MKLRVISAVLILCAVFVTCTHSNAGDTGSVNSYSFLVSTESDEPEADIEAPDEPVTLSDEEQKALLSSIDGEKGGDKAEENTEKVTAPKTGSKKSGKRATYAECNVPLSYDLTIYTLQEAQKYGIDPDLVFCVMWQESRFNPTSVSSTGDYGIMQINKCHLPALQKMYGIETMEDMFNPYYSIDFGVRLLSNYIKKYNNLSLALMCYNLGESGAKAKWAQNVYTTSYCDKIIDKMGSFVTYTTVDI